MEQIVDTMDDLRVELAKWIYEKDMEKKVKYLYMLPGFSASSLSPCLVVRYPYKLQVTMYSEN